MLPHGFNLLILVNYHREIVLLGKPITRSLLVVVTFVLVNEKSEFLVGASLAVMLANAVEDLVL